MKKTLFILILPLALLLSSIYTIPVQARMTPQEREIISVLYPKPTKKSVSYPAKLTVNIDSEEIVLEGTCGMYVEIPPEEMVDILERAIKGTDTPYTYIIEAINDKRTVDALTDKLNIGDTSGEAVIENYKKIFGVDNLEKIFNLLSMELSNEELFDMINPLPNVDGINGNYNRRFESGREIVEFGLNAKDIAQLLLKHEKLKDYLISEANGVGLTLVLNSVQVTLDEYAKYQEKYKDIIELANSRERLRKYYSNVEDLILGATSEKGSWKIRIDDQKTFESVYNPLYGQKVPCTLTADIELINPNGDTESICGNYTGKFIVREFTDLSEYDRNRCALFVKYMNEGMGSFNQNIGAAIGHDMTSVPFEEVSNTINKPSESYFTLSADDVMIRLEMPYGVNRTLFNLPLDTMALEQTEYVNTCDYKIVSKQETKEAIVTHTYMETYDTSSFYEYDHSIAELRVYPFTKVETNNNDSGALLSDIRPYIKLTLEIDMFQ